MPDRAPDTRSPRSEARAARGPRRASVETSIADRAHLDRALSNCVLRYRQEPGTDRSAAMSTATRTVLETPAQEFADATANPPYLFDLGPEEGRRTVDEVQSGTIDKPAADIEDLTVHGGPAGEVPVRIVRPQGAAGPLPVILYVHGAGWVFGNRHTHDR